MDNIHQLRRVSFAPTEASVTSPYRPKREAHSSEWRNSDTIYPRTPAHIERIKQMPAANQPMRAASPQLVINHQEPAKKLGWARRAIGLLGVASISVGTIGGLVAIAALGPIALAIAAGAFVLGMVLIRVSAGG